MTPHVTLPIKTQLGKTYFQNTKICYLALDVAVCMPLPVTKKPLFRLACASVVELVLT